MTPPTRVWLLNLDADAELATRGDYTPAKRVIAKVAALQPKVMHLLGPGDMPLQQWTEALSHNRLAVKRAAALGAAWCPTARAVARLSQAGVVPLAAPSMQVLRRVNHRAFCDGLGATLDGAAFVTDEAQLVRVMNAQRPALGWLLKRPFSTSGSGRRRVMHIDPCDEGWLAASWRHGGVMAEPFVQRLLDVSLHGYLDRTGQLTAGRPLRQHCDERGQWLGSQPLAARELPAEDQRALREALSLVAAALAEARYFGPFGIDGFSYLDGEHVRFNPRCEINARYTMNWVAGMAGQRPDLASG